MDQNFLKITYHLGAKKMNAYLKMPSPTYHVLKKEIEMCLFEERKQPRCEIRTFWIDEDQDEIEIVNQCDYDIFMAKRSERQHLQVAPLNAMNVDEQPAEAAASQTSIPSNQSSATANQSKIPPAAGSYDFAVHEHVECDACLMAPIIGFRYKCIQCPNYDLCQNCESKHIHSEHMMVRMPTNNCPNVIEAYVTGRTFSGRRHGKRSKTSCPFVKNGLSVVIDDDNESPNAGGGETGENSSPSNGKERHHGRKHHRRHHRNNFFSHLYEMMHDLAEGGGAAAAAHAMGETTTATKTTTSSSTTGPKTTSTTATSSSNANGGTENVENPLVAAAAAAAAKLAAQQAHETAVKAAEIAAKVAHETALNAAKNMTENMAASQSSTTSAAPEAGEKEATKEKVDATTSPRDAESQANNVPVIPSPSLETLAQFLDPQYMKTGIQILNNFSDMFSKMLDPMEGTESNENQLYPNLRKNSTTSTKSSVASNLNSLASDKKCDKEKSIEKEQTNNEAKQPESDVSSHVEIDDLGSDSENESVSESFIKLDAPKESNMGTSSSSFSSKSSSAQTTPPQSLDKSKTMDFSQLSADLKAHIAEEAKKDTQNTKETTVTTATTSDDVDNAQTAKTITSTTTASEPLVTTTTSTSTSTTNATQTKKPEEKRAVPVYHADQHINNAIIAMMSMGFSNEGAWLTQLLESVNGNIPEALDLMSVAQRGGSR